MTFTEEAFSIVKEKGLFITSGIISTKKEEVKKSLQKSGFEIEEVMMMEDWVTIISRKPLL
jgi:ribosomal protein L11 methyltransferase